MQASQPVPTNSTDGSVYSTEPSLLVNLQDTIAQSLRPNLQRIDVQGEYPEEFLRAVGALGGFKQSTPVAMGGSGVGAKLTIQIMEEIAADCLSTGFLIWCQTVCAWYIQHSENQYLQEQVLPGIINGTILAGTALSNPMKHFAGIEKLRLTAQRCSGGYILRGAIPWVSNIEPDHHFAIVAQIEGEDAQLMAVLPANLPGLTLGNGGQFIALEGSSTFSCMLKDVFVPEQLILASPCREFLTTISPGFILTQTGFGLGLVNSCIELMKRTNVSKKHVNCFLDDQVADIEMSLCAARQDIYALADEIGCGDTGAVRPGLLREVIQARILAAELSLRASQAAMLHAGASGYRLHSTFERKLRESYFVAIVTPALKHLKKVLHDLSSPV